MPVAFMRRNLFGARRGGCVLPPSGYKAGKGAILSKPERSGRCDHVPMPTADAISGFIAATFRSVWALELLWILRRNRERSLSRAEMVSELRGSSLVVTQSLDSLATAGLVLVEPDGSARYGPASKAIDGLAAATEELYARRPDAVRRVIVSAANPGVTAFADAFRLRKD
jgi:hypothetical protein